MSRAHDSVGSDDQRGMKLPSDIARDPSHNLLGGESP